MRKNRGIRNILVYLPVLITVLLYAFLAYSAATDNVAVVMDILKGWMGIVALVVYIALMNAYMFLIGERGQTVKNLNSFLIFFSFVVWVVANSALLVNYRRTYGSIVVIIEAAVIILIWLVIKLLFRNW